MISSFLDFSPQISKQAFVHEMATVIGDVVIKQRASIWPGAVLRGDMGLIEIGEETSIQDGCICHATQNESTTVIGNRVVVGHRAVLHGCKVQNDCLIGMGAILLDNSVIGEGSLIGAGSIITPGIKIPPNSFVVGVAGKIKRQTTAAERASIAQGCQHYTEQVSLNLKA